ncbi:hypothetical protein PUMCH_000156 [Australozyma saopauloensis]|uniref:Uncharacterized protein n=1 Tax=Australozyma saopauloensis TaxID=291208 RepID=A0AAX4H369_9ASCO|nr:hypothetical protein PUMCH_000156 [[Candida] saopauloensis]
MDNAAQIKHSVAKVQQELGHILRLVEGVSFSPDITQDFRAKLIAEFNDKLRAFKAKNQLLRDENSKLKQQVSVLESKLEAFEERIAKLQRSEAAKSASLAKQRPRESVEPSLRLTTSTSMKPPQERRSNSKKDSPIFSSPIKVNDDSQGKGNNVVFKSPTKKTSPREITSSQFNMLPTQYSDASSLPKKDFDFAKTKKREHSPEINSDDSTLESEDIVADSQDEFEPLKINSTYDDGPNPIDEPNYPSNYTSLQRIEFLRTYYRLKLEEKDYQFDLTKNPITEKPWALDDFIPNPEWRPSKKLNTNLGVMTKTQEQRYQDFFKEAGFGAKPAGPKWADTMDTKASENDDDDDEWVRSQIMDKYLSPPGYMVGDFMSTQEAEENKAISRQKIQARVNRRLKSAFNREEFIFYEEVFNSVVRAGRVKRTHK